MGICRQSYQNHLNFHNPAASWIQFSDIFRTLFWVCARYCCFMMMFESSYFKWIRNTENTCTERENTLSKLELSFLLMLLCVFVFLSFLSLPFTLSLSHVACRKLCLLNFERLYFAMFSPVWIKYSLDECCLNFKWTDLLLFCVIVFSLKQFSIYILMLLQRLYKTSFRSLIMHCEQ